MKKDLEWLNSKWWYRLLKVTYVGAFLAASGLYIAFAVVELAPEQVIDNSASTMRCTDGNHKTYSFDELDYSTAFSLRYGSELAVIKIATLCELDNAFGETVNEDSGLPLRDKLERLQNNPDLVSEWEERVQDSYEVSVIKKTEGGWGYVFLASLAAVAFMALLFEIARRVFYYIVLGTFRPKK